MKHRPALSILYRTRGARLVAIGTEAFQLTYAPGFADGRRVKRERWGTVRQARAEIANFGAPSFIALF